MASVDVLRRFRGIYGRDPLPGEVPEKMVPLGKFEQEQQNDPGGEINRILDELYDISQGGGEDVSGQLGGGFNKILNLLRENQGNYPWLRGLPEGDVTFDQGGYDELAGFLQGRGKGMSNEWQMDALNRLLGRFSDDGDGGGDGGGGDWQNPPGWWNPPGGDAFSSFGDMDKFPGFFAGQLSGMYPGLNAQLPFQNQLGQLAQQLAQMGLPEEQINAIIRNGFPNQAGMTDATAGELLRYQRPILDNQTLGELAQGGLGTMLARGFPQQAALAQDIGGQLYGARQLDPQVSSALSAMMGGFPGQAQFSNLIPQQLSRLGEVQDPVLAAIQAQLKGLPLQAGLERSLGSLLPGAAGAGRDAASAAQALVGGMPGQQDVARLIQSMLGGGALPGQNIQAPELGPPSALRGLEFTGNRLAGFVPPTPFAAAPSELQDIRSLAGRAAGMQPNFNVPAIPQPAIIANLAHTAGELAGARPSPALSGGLDASILSQLQGISPEMVAALRSRVLEPAREQLLGGVNRQFGGVAGSLESPLRFELERRMESDFINDLIRQSTGIQQAGTQAGLARIGQGLGAQQAGAGLFGDIAGRETGLNEFNAQLLATLQPQSFAAQLQGLQTGGGLLSTASGQELQRALANAGAGTQNIQSIIQSMSAGGGLLSTAAEQETARQEANRGAGMGAQQQSFQNLLQRLGLGLQGFGGLAQAGTEATRTAGGISNELLNAILSGFSGISGRGLEATNLGNQIAAGLIQNPLAAYQTVGNLGLGATQLGATTAGNRFQNATNAFGTLGNLGLGATGQGFNAAGQNFQNALQGFQGVGGMGLNALDLGARLPLQRQTLMSNIFAPERAGERGFRSDLLGIGGNLVGAQFGQENVRNQLQAGGLAAFGQGLSAGLRPWLPNINWNSGGGGAGTPPTFPFGAGGGGNPFNDNWNPFGWGINMPTSPWTTPSYSPPSFRRR